MAKKITSWVNLVLCAGLSIPPIPIPFLCGNVYFRSLTIILLYFSTLFTKIKPTVKITFYCFEREIMFTFSSFQTSSGAWPARKWQTDLQPLEVSTSVFCLLKNYISFYLFRVSAESQKSWNLHLEPTVRSHSICEISHFLWFVQVFFKNFIFKISRFL